MHVAIKGLSLPFVPRLSLRAFFSFAKVVGPPLFVAVYFIWRVSSYATVPVVGFAAFALTAL